MGIGASFGFDEEAIYQDADIEQAEYEAAARERATARGAGHDCDENAVPYVSDGALGHGWECGICGRFLQAG